MNKNYAFGIPTLNRADLLIPSLMSYVKDYPDIKIYVLDNGNQKIDFKHENIEIIKQDRLSVGASWNILCRKIYEQHEFAIILNDDIYLGVPQRNIEYLLTTRFDILRPTIDWSVFILSRGIYEEVGAFDEIFYPAYYEDKSYERRMRLKRFTITKTYKLNPHIHRSSKTLEKSPELDSYRTVNRDKYVEMWGGLPEREKYTTPYNAVPEGKKKKHAHG